MILVGSAVEISVELACNWRDIKNIVSKKNEFLPDIRSLEKDGLPVCSALSSVLIPLHEKDINIIEMRDWLDANITKKMVMYNRFNYVKFPYRVEQNYLGTNFKFTCLDEACLFKLFWW